MISKVIYVGNLCSKNFAVFFILTDALFLLWSINRFIFSSKVLCYFVWYLMSLAILKRGIFWSGILLIGIFSFGTLRLGIFCHVTVRTTLLLLHNILVNPTTKTCSGCFKTFSFLFLLYIFFWFYNTKVFRVFNFFYLWTKKAPCIVLASKQRFWRFNCLLEEITINVTIAKNIIRTNLHLLRQIQIDNK